MPVEIPEQFREIIQAGLENAEASDRRMNERFADTPPWLAFPDLEFPSLAWRMGAAESYLSAFEIWFQSLDGSAKAAYVSRFPAPAEWGEYYERLV